MNLQEVKDILADSGWWDSPFIKYHFKENSFKTNVEPHGQYELKEEDGAIKLFVAKTSLFEVKYVDEDKLKVIVGRDIITFNRSTIS